MIYIEKLIANISILVVVPFSMRGTTVVSNKGRECSKAVKSDVSDDWPLLVHMPAAVPPQGAKVLSASLQKQSSQQTAAPSASQQPPEESHQEFFFQLRSGLRWRDR